MRILIVEDDKSVGMLLQRILKPLDAETYVAHDWQACVEALRVMQFDAVCLDLGLPDSTTAETLAKIRDLKMQSPQTAILVITGNPRITSSDAANAGADGLLYKSEAFETPSLIRNISALIAKIKGTDNKGKVQLQLAKQATENFIQNLQQ